MERDEQFPLDGTVIRETRLAWLFFNDADNGEYWLPKSQCEWDPASQRMTVPGWLIMEKGITTSWL